MNMPNNMNSISFDYKNNTLLNSYLNLDEILHSQRVSYYSVKIGQAIGLSSKEISSLSFAAFFHDIGKSLIDKNLLLLPRKLTDNEFNEVKKHTEKGYIIAKKYPALSPYALDILYHHENYCGHGYPKGISGENIPLYSRIIRIADYFDALTSPRPYKNLIPFDEAISQLKNSSKVFDPYIFDKFLKISDTLRDYNELSTNTLVNFNSISTIY